MPSIELTPDRLQAVLDYDPLTGFFSWKVATELAGAAYLAAKAVLHGVAA